MSRRTSQLQPVSLIAVAGVNQRMRATELPLHQYPNLEGVFPEFAGLQSRVWGKRLLQKYATGIYGIHQFWLPQGYGGGLYQFDGTLDFGQWLTPNSSFDLSVPPLGFDGGNMTYDEFGNPYGSNFGYGTDNTCLISFLNGSSDHSSCAPPPSPADTPNDHNGGPAGQGRSCQWSIGDVLETASVPVAGYLFGSDSEHQITAAGPLPYPIFPSLTATEPVIYSAAAGPFGFIWYGSYSEQSYKINLGFGSWQDHQLWESASTRGTLNLAAVIPDPINHPPISVELKIRHNGNPPFVHEWVPLAEGLTAGATTVEISMWDYIVRNYETGPHPLGGGFFYRDFVVIEGIRANYNGRQCV